MELLPLKSPDGRGTAGPDISDLFNWDTTTEEILRFCAERLRAESASMFLMDSSNKRLQLVKALGPRRNRHISKIIHVGDGVSGRVAAKGEPLLVHSGAEDPWIIPRKEDHRSDTFMSCPVISDSSVLAVVNVGGCGNGKSFRKTDMEAFEELAEISAPLLERTIAYWRPFNGDDQPTWLERGAPESLEDIAKQLEGLKVYNESVLKIFRQYAWIFDHQLNVTCCSGEGIFMRSYGQPDDAGAVGGCVLNLPFDVDRGELEAKLTRMLAEGTPFSLKGVRIKGCADFHVVNMSFSPFFSAQARIIGGLLMVEDDTENYKIRRRLVESEKLSLIGSLTSMITHEINNPLDGVMRLINLSVGQLDEQDPVREYLGEAQKGVQRMASLVKSLLSFSRKSMVLEAEFTPLNTIVDNTVSVIRNRNEHRNISFEMDLASENPIVRTNDFYQMISNLLSNAFDAIEDGGGVVRLLTKADDASLRVIVRDNGCGIPERMRPRIFRTFWTTKEQGKGTGLGLAIVKKLVEKYDGTIEVESEENVGTKMELTFSLDKLMT